MKATPEVRVTLSDELFTHLRHRALELRIPLDWLVAGLICDTIEGFANAKRSRADPKS